MSAEALAVAEVSRMTIRAHQILMRVVYPLGMFVGFLAMWPVIWFAVNVLGLPSPGGDSAGGVVMALAVIAAFFTLAYGGARLAVVIAQRWVRADCPRCGQAAVGVTFAAVISGPYRCRACGYDHSDR